MKSTGEAMRIHTKKTGKETLIITPLPEGFEKGVLTKKLQQLLDKHGHFQGKETQAILKQGKTDELIMGIGKPQQDEIRKFGARAAVYARDQYYTDYAIDLTGFPSHVQAAVEGSLLGLYQYREYKKRTRDEPIDPAHLTIIAEHVKNKDISQGKILAESIMLVRDLVNRPGSDKYPEQLASIAKQLGKKHGFTVKILGKKEMEKIGMGAILGVHRGSSREPQLVLLELGKGKNPDTALVGKGVTYDTGGLQIKQADGMVDMKLDMAGAATVLGTIVALARLGYQGSIVGALGLVENVIGPNAFKPGDILTACNGKTIEIKHTDAEGRVVISDVISYVEKQYRPAKIIDLATLTGGTLTALGVRIATLIGTNQGLVEAIKTAAQETDELVWQLPLYPHHYKLIESARADIDNNGKKIGGYSVAQTIVAGAIISQFVNTAAWAHLDIAGTAYAYETGPYISAQGTGWGVRLLTKLING